MLFNGHVIGENSTLQSGIEDMVEIPQEQYGSDINILDMVILNSIEESNLEHTLCDLSFSASDIITAINEITNNSTLGPDRFFAIVVKERRHHFAVPWPFSEENELTISIFPMIIFLIRSSYSLNKLGGLR